MQLVSPQRFECSEGHCLTQQVLTPHIRILAALVLIQLPDNGVDKVAEYVPNAHASTIHVEDSDGILGLCLQDQS